MSLRVVVVVLVAVAVDHERARTNTHAVSPSVFWSVAARKKSTECARNGKIVPIGVGPPSGELGRATRVLITMGGPAREPTDSEWMFAPVMSTADKPRRY